MDLSQSVNRIVAEAKRPDLRELPSATIATLIEDASAERDQVAAEMNRLGQGLSDAKSQGRWRDMGAPAEQILSLREQFRQTDTHLARLREAYQQRVLDERVLARLGSERSVRFLEYAILALIAMVLAMLGIESALDLSEAGRDALAVADTAICVVFLWEFFWRMQFAQSKVWYVRRHWLDFVASLPLAGLLRVGRVARVARGARALRLARLARVARLARALRALAFLSRGFDKIAAIFKLQVFSRPLILTAVLLMVGGFAISQLEGTTPTGEQVPAVRGMWQGMWWSFTTIITGGFGDIHNPETSWGRYLTGLLVILGMILTGALTAGLASILLGDDTERIERQQALMQAQLDEISGHLGRLEQLLRVGRQ